MRVLLVFDDYQELMITETYLKKVGFDVVGIMNEMSIQEQIVAFNPEVVVVNGKGNKVSSFSVGRKMKDIVRYEGKVVLVVPKNVRPDPNELMKMKMDALMEAPVQADRLIHLLAKYLGISADAMLDKLKRARLSDPELNKKMMMITGRPTPPEKLKEKVEKNPTPQKDPLQTRAQKYEQFIAETHIDSKQTSFDKNQLKKRQDDLKKTWDYSNLEEIDKLKREFATALFKKK